MEAFWAYALYTWLAAAAGVRSRRFAMWSAAGVFALSLAGQSAARIVGAKVMTAFANGMPVIVLALIAILVHLRQLDRAAAEESDRVRRAAELEAQQSAAAADERTVLRVELETARAETETARLAASEAERRATETARQNDIMARKLAAQKPNRTRAKAPNAGRRKAPNTAPETTVPEDFDARTQALEAWLENPKISGKDLGAAVGLGERWGQLRKNEFATASNGQSPEGGG